MNHVMFAVLGAMALGCVSDPQGAVLSAQDDGGAPSAARTQTPRLASPATPKPVEVAKASASTEAPSGTPPPAQPPEVAASEGPSTTSSGTRKAPAPIPRVTEMCAAPKRTCCCSPSDLLCAMKCGVWNEAAPAGMLGSCLAQCRAGSANACLRAALSFERGVGVEKDPQRAQELRDRTCKLDAFVGGCTGAAGKTAR